MSAQRAFAIAAAFALASAGAAPAHADPTPQKRSAADDAVRADHLFTEAKKLVREGRYADACPKLEESERLDSALGTQFNLADCYEHTGRAARAWALFTRVAAIAKEVGKRDRERAAVERASVLEAKLARVIVKVKDPVPGLEVHRDGVLWPRESIGQPELVDPGPVSITASAPGREGFATRFVVVAGEARTIEIPALVATAAPAGRAGPPAPDVAAAPVSDSSEGLRGQQVVAITVGAVGVVALAVGGVFGVVSLTKHDEAKSVCPEPSACSDRTAASTWTAATTAGTISTIGIVVGVVALGVSGALWFTTPRRQAVASRSLDRDLTLHW